MTTKPVSSPMQKICFILSTLALVAGPTTRWNVHTNSDVSNNNNANTGDVFVHSYSLKPVFLSRQHKKCPNSFTTRRHHNPRGHDATSTTSICLLRDPLIMMPSQTPMVPYKAPGSQYTQFVSIEAAMYKDRTMMINKYIDENVANNIISILLYLRNESPRDKISLYFNVPGGELRPSLAIYDLLQNTKKNCIIETVNLGLCAGMGAILCSSGTKGHRSAMPNSRFLLQRIGMDNVYQGQATDIALEVKNVKLWNDQLQYVMANVTGQSPERIANDIKRDFYLVADEAVQYGLIDRVLLPSIRKRSARNTEADLGNFDMENIQKYQMKQEGQGGWGSSTPGTGSTGNTSPPGKAKSKPKDDRYDDDGNPNVM